MFSVLPFYTHAMVDTLRPMFSKARHLIQNIIHCWLDMVYANEKTKLNILFYDPIPGDFILDCVWQIISYIW